MLASKQFDIVLGIDIHIVLTPAGVPVPMPHPFIGMVFDVFAFLPFIGSTINVNGIPKTTAGTEGRYLPFHFPIGGAFTIPPGNECEVFMGSATVLGEGEPLSRMAMPTLSCQSIGIPSPPRKAKKPPKKTFFLPTSTLITIPMGMAVNVGGPPTINMMAIMMRLGLKGLGKLRKSKFMKKVSDKIHDAASALMKKLKIPAGLRNKAHRAICFVTGHPVDIPTGKVFTDTIDFELPGPIPLKWERVWYSTSDYEGPLGHGWHHCYDMKLAVDEPSGAVVVLLADGRNAVFSMPAYGEELYDRKEKITLIRDEHGLAVKDTNRLTYRFKQCAATHELCRLERVESATGHAIQFAYNTQDHLEGITDSTGRKLGVICDASGRITKISTRNGEEEILLARYAYDPAGNLIRFTDAMDQKASYGYERHLMIRETDRNGLSFCFEYDGIDEEARCIRTWGDRGIYDHKLTYLDGVTIVENSLGHQTTYVHNDYGLVSKVIDPEGNIHLTEYNEFNELVSETDALGNTTAFVYDERGNQTGVIAPDGATTSVFYENQLPVMVGLPNGASYIYSHNEQGQITSRVSPEGNITRYDYRDGLLHSISDTNGGVTSLVYDTAYNLARMELPDGSVSQWEYDALGNCISSTDPNGNRRRLKYNKLGRVTDVAEPDGNYRKLTYDGEGNIIHAKDEQHEVKFEYRGMGKMVAREEHNTRIEFEYDTEEQLRAIRNEHGKTYRFELNALGEVTEEIGFDHLRRQYKRDAGGRVQTVVRQGGKLTRYKYDEAGRIIRADYGDGGYEYFEYDKNGDLLGAGNNEGAVVFERDKEGRVIKEIQDGVEITRTYDYTGNCTGVKSSLGADIRYKRNQMGDVLEASTGNGESDWKVNFERDSFGLEAERTLPGGIRSRWKRDRLGRPVHHLVQKGVSVQRSKFYSWGMNDRLKHIADELNDTRVSFGHDPFGNLAWASYGDDNLEYRLPDAVGNLFKTKEQKDRKYGDAGQLLEAGKAKYFYDEEGNLLRKIADKGVVWDYEWFDNGHLKKVKRPDGNEVSFTYDALGRRTSKTYLKKTTRWVWDGNVPLHEWVEEDKTSESINAQGELVLAGLAPGEQVTTWVFEDSGSFVPMAKLRGDKQYSIITDHLGTPVQMFNLEGDKIWQCELNSYGEVKSMEGHRTSCPFRYQGQYEDIETGLYYNRFRYYNPEDGQYISQDPIRTLGGNNLYGYVDDPNYWIDVLGLAKIKNKVDGDAREAKVLEDLKQQYPDATIVKERYLRDSSGKSIKDPLTDSRRRVDFAVIQDGKVVDMIEVTSPTADKTMQVNKEARIRATGDVYIRDPKTKKLYNVTNVQTRRVNCQ